MSWKYTVFFDSNQSSFGDSEKDKGSLLNGQFVYNNFSYIYFPVFENLYFIVRKRKMAEKTEMWLANAFFPLIGCFALA